MSRPGAHALGMLGGAPYRNPMRRNQSAYLERRGLLESEVDAQRQRVYRLTRAGVICALGGRDPVEGWQRPWDGLWRMVIYDIPETDRRLRLKLRRELSSNGFGCLQRSVWLSPHPAEDLKRNLVKLKIDVSMVAFLESRIDRHFPPEKVAFRAWNFRRIDSLYKRHQALLKRAPDVKATGSSIRQWALQERSSWSVIARRDPFLPDCLLPRGYSGKEVWRSRLRTLRKVAPHISRALMEDPADA